MCVLGMYSRILLLVLVLLVAVSSANNGYFLVLTDIHLDPYYNPEYNHHSNCRNDSYWIPEEQGQPPNEEIEAKYKSFIPSFYEMSKKGTLSTPIPPKQWFDSLPEPNFNYGQKDCDAPYPLVDSAFNATHSLLPDPDFILFTGDMAAHDLPTWGTRTTAIIDGSELLRSRYPNVTIYPSIGNNDLYPDNFLRVDGRKNRWLENLWDIWSTNFSIPADQKTVFQSGGYYSAEISPYLTLISLNSIIYYTDHDPTTNETDPLNQFAWLNSTLQNCQAANKTVYIIGHVYPTYNKWQEQYLRHYMALVREYQDIIKAQYFGHSNSDNFYLMWDERDREQPMSSFFETPSVGPASTNPSFRIYQYDTVYGNLLDYWQYYMDLFTTEYTGTVKWILEYQFTVLYEQEAPDTMGVWGALQMVAQSVELYNVNNIQEHSQLTDGEDRTQRICSLYDNSALGYARCLANGYNWYLHYESKTNQVDIKSPTEERTRVRQGRDRDKYDELMRQLREILKQLDEME